MKVAELSAAGVIPQPIVDKLTRLLRRVRRLIVLRGACAVAATAIGSLLAVMAIDATVTLFSLTTRWALTLSAYGATAVVALWFLVRPLARSFTLAGVARAIEAHHPELQERISSAVELLTSKDAPELRGSDELIHALVLQASDSARGLQPRREITLRAARPYLMAAGGVAALFAAVFIAWPDQAAFLLKRASAPFINLPNLRARDLVVSPGNVVILEGQRLQVEVEVPGRTVRGVSLLVTGTDGAEAAWDMTRLVGGADAQPRFAFTCPPATQSFRYRVHAGDALSSYYAATVVARPAIEQLVLQYEFPKYTRREPVTEPRADGDIRALAGTVVTVTAKTNKPMAAAALLLNGQPATNAKGEPLVQPELVAEGADAPAVSFRVTVATEVAGKWSLQLTDEHGFASSSAEHTIEVVPDGAPTVAVIRPEAKQLRLPPTAPLPIAYTIEDDIGLAGAELLLEVDGRGRPSKPVTLPPAAGKAPQRAVTGETVLQLGAMDLRNAKYVTFQLRARDNCPREFKGPHHGVSDLYRIELDVRAPSFAVAQLMEQEKKLKQSLEKVKKDLEHAKRDSERLREDLPKAKEATEKDNKRVDAMRKELASADSTARKVAEEMKGGYFDKLADKVKDLADEHIAKAENLAGQIKLAEQPAERGMLARETDRVVDRSLRMVEELLKEVEPVSDVVRRAIEMNEMAQREADLAREKLAAEQAQAAEAGMTPEEWQKAQQALAQEFGEMLKETPGGPQAAAAMAQQAAADMAQQARQMAQEQDALAKQNPQLGKIQEIDKALGDLARQQQQLAQDAAAGAASQPQAQPMGEAAQNIQAGNLARAVQNQAAAEGALRNAAQQMAQGQAPAAAPQGENPAQKGAAEGQPAGEQGQPQGGEPAGGEQGAPAPQTAEQVAGLAQRQAELREETEALAAQRQQLAAEHAQGQVDRLAAEQGEVAREAAALAENVNNVAPQADQLQNRAAEAAAGAAQALQANQMARAAQQATDAGNRLAQLTDRLEAAAAQPFTDRPAAQQAQAGAAQGQQNPQQGGEQAPAGAQPQGANEGQPEGAPQGAENAAQGGEQAAAGAPQGANEGQPEGAPQGAENAAQGGEQAPAGAPQGANEGQPQGAPQGAENAAQGGEQAAAGAPQGANEGQPEGAPQGQQNAPQGQGQPPAGAQPGGQPNGDQGATAQLAQQAAGLAERQQQLAREMQALAAQNPLAQAAAEQAALAERAGDLAQSAAALQQQANQLGAGEGQASQAAAQLGQAQQEAARAAGQLAEAAGQQGQGQQGQGQGQPQGEGQPGQGAPSPGAATPSQQGAAQALSAAAQALDALGQQMANAAAQQPSPAAPGQPGSPSPAPGTPGQMAGAYGAASQAAAAQSGMSAAQAAGQMGQMAAQSAGQAMASGGNLMNQPHPKGGGNPTMGTGVQSTDLSESKLRELGIKLEDWARLPGELRDQILQAANDLGPEEYRPLIKRYFQEVARRGGVKPQKPEAK